MPATRCRRSPRKSPIPKTSSPPPAHSNPATPLPLAPVARPPLLCVAQSFLAVLLESHLAAVRIAPATAPHPAPPADHAAAAPPPPCLRSDRFPHRVARLCRPGRSGRCLLIPGRGSLIPLSGFPRFQL